MPKARLLELSAQSLGVIEQAHLEFQNGFCVLTGETGAGKTLLLGALELCLGGEGSQSRHAVTSETKAAVVFEYGDSDVVLAREASSSGRLRATLNGLASNAEALRNASEPLIVIHGQHDSLTLKSRAEILKLVDAYGAIDTSAFDALTQEIASLKKLRDSVGGDEAGRQRELDFLTFQAQEIESAKIVGPNELTDALLELQRLSELRDGQVAIRGAIEALDGTDNSVLDQFAEALNQIPRIDAFDKIRKVLTESLTGAREATRDLAALSDPEAFDAASLAELESRVGVLQALVRKYGQNLQEVIDKGQALVAEINERREAAAKLATVDADLGVLQDRWNQEAAQLLSARVETCDRLTSRVATQLTRVALPHASLRFEVSGAAGNQIEILFAPNPGQGEGPLQALASGGELSRVLLALSLETSNTDQVAIFDEVDAGVGGQVAQQIGDCLREVGQRQQVLAVTHLASVAAKANQHFVIEKSVDSGRAFTTVREVTGEERVREIARMLSGEVNDASIGLAKHLLQDS